MRFRRQRRGERAIELRHEAPPGRRAAVEEDSRAAAGDEAGLYSSSRFPSSSSLAMRRFMSPIAGPPAAVLGGGMVVALEVGSVFLAGRPRIELQVLGGGIMMRRRRFHTSRGVAR